MLELLYIAVAAPVAAPAIEVMMVAVDEGSGTVEELRPQPADADVAEPSSWYAQPIPNDLALCSLCTERWTLSPALDRSSLRYYEHGPPLERYGDAHGPRGRTGR